MGFCCHTSPAYQQEVSFSIAFNNNSSPAVFFSLMFLRYLGSLNIFNTIQRPSTVSNVLLRHNDKEFIELWMNHVIMTSNYYTHIFSVNSTGQKLMYNSFHIFGPINTVPDLMTS